MRPKTASRVLFRAIMNIVKHNNPKQLLKCRKYLEQFTAKMEREYNRQNWPFGDRAKFKATFKPSFGELYYISDRWRCPHRLCYLLDTIEFINTHSMEEFAKLSNHKL
jgi:hypothetical protein